MTDLKRTPLYGRQRECGARFVPFTGWELPVQYVGITQEHHAVRNAAGLFDVSHMGRLWLEGAGAQAAIDALVTNDVGALAVGRALYTVACNDAGGILDDLIVYRVAPERLLVVCNASNRAKISAHFAAATRGQCDFEDRSEATVMLALQGPAAVDTMRNARAAEAALALDRMGVVQSEVAGVAALVARTGYTGEDGFEVFVGAADAVATWDALLNAGEGLGVTPIGLGARDTLRLEARLMLYGNDIDETTNPYEAGLGWVVKLDKGDFAGREALAAVKRDAPSRKLIGLEMMGRGIARTGHPVVDASGAAVGKVTSGAPGLTVGKNIALAYVPTALAKLGTHVNVEIRGKAVEAVVVKTPFYRRSAPAEAVAEA